jgi:hypothetical protein
MATKQSIIDPIPPASHFAAMRDSAGEKPKGLQSHSDDIVAFWDYETGGIYCIPKFVKLSDSKLDRSKVSYLMFATLVRPRLLATGEGVSSQCKEGDLIGVWLKPGMRNVRRCAGAKTWIEYTGEKDVGKGNPMKTFTVDSDGTGTVLPILEDNRQHSKGAELFLTLREGSV